MPETCACGFDTCDGYEGHGGGVDTPIDVRWSALLAAVQITWHEHREQSPEGCRCHLCRVYESDWWA